MMKKPKPLLITIWLLLLVLLVAGPAAAQGVATAQGTGMATLVPADPAAGYTVGDPIHLTLTVQHPAGTQLIVPDLPEQWGDFTLVQLGNPDTVPSGDGWKTTTFQMDVRLFAPGEFTTPPLTLQLADTSGPLSGLDIAPLMVNVQSVLVAGDTTLRDIKPPVDLPAGNFWLLFLGGLLLGTLGVGGTVWWWRRHRLQPVPVDNRPAHVIALDELEQLAAQNLPAQRQFKAYYTTLADIVRRFLARQYSLSIQEQTTTEINHSLQQLPLSKGLRQRYIAILHACDLVKFADAPSGPAEAASILAETRDTIQAAYISLSTPAADQAALTPPAMTLPSAPLEVRP